MSSPTTMSIEKKMGCLWITLPDSISMYNSHELEKTIIGNMVEGVNVVFDFSRTHDLYSSGLGLIIRLRKAINEHNGALCLVNVSEKLRELMIALNLNKVLSIYSTDVEFEISREDFVQRRMAEDITSFLFVAQVENKIYRINISGQMIDGARFDLCEQFFPSPNVAIYIIDFSGLEMIDEKGAKVLFELTRKIHEKSAQCRAFGVEEWIKNTISIFEADQFMKFYDDEKSAILNTGS